MGSSDQAIAYKSLDVFSLPRKHKSQSLMTAKVLAKKVSSRTESMGRTHSENSVKSPGNDRVGALSCLTAQRNEKKKIRNKEMMATFKKQNSKADKCQVR